MKVDAPGVLCNVVGRPLYSGKNAHRIGTVAPESRQLKALRQSRSVHDVNM